MEILKKVNCFDSPGEALNFKAILLNELITTHIHFSHRGIFLTGLIQSSL